MREKLGKDAPAGRPIGESWEISGWGNSQTVVSAGEYKGLTLGELYALGPNDLVGAAGKGSFPLLFKFIDARENLSIQVHPNSEQARARGWGERGKTEAWYIVDAAEGAQIAIGFNRGGITRAEAAEAAAAGRFESLLNFIPARRGDAFFIPAGTVHAILGGVLVYEVQEESDSTLRLYDWNRRCPAGSLRKLHIADALDIINYGETDTIKPEPAVIDKGDAFVREALCDSSKFTLCRYRFSKSGEAALAEIDGFGVVSVTDGLMSVRTGARRAPLALGQTILLPPMLKDTFIEGVAGSEALVTTR